MMIKRFVLPIHVECGLTIVVGNFRPFQIKYSQLSALLMFLLNTVQ